MRTEVKVAFLIVPIVIIGCIVFFVTQSQKASQDVADVVHFDAPQQDDGGAASVTREPQRRRTQTTQRPAQQTTRAPAGQPREPAARATRQPSTPRPETRTEPPADDLRERIRQLAGLGGPESSGSRQSAPNKPVDESTTPPAERASKPGTEPSRDAATRRPAVRPATTQPATPRSEVRPPRDTTSRQPRPTERLPGLRPGAGAEKRHTIEAGQTLWEIAEYYYGDGRLYRRILDANPELDQQRLKVGSVIVIPPEEPIRDDGAKERARTPGVRKHTYVVERGDSLISIARDVLKDESLWRKIYELNRDKLANPNVLQPGTELKLPTD